MIGGAPDSLRILALVQQLNDKFGAQELGQIMQTLLALTFQGAGFHVLKNAVGVPDLLAYREETPPGYAIEAKTGDTTITLSPRDLQGVVSNGRTPIVAAFFLADPAPRWWIVDARSLQPRTYRRYEIATKPPVDVGFRVNEHFPMILAKHFSAAIEGQGPLARLLTQ
jgi:hypothetical protein